FASVHPSSSVGHAPAKLPDAIPCGFKTCTILAGRKLSDHARLFDIKSRPVPARSNHYEWRSLVDIAGCVSAKPYFHYFRFAHSCALGETCRTDLLIGVCASSWQKRKAPPKRGQFHTRTLFVLATLLAAALLAALARLRLLLTRL